MKKLLILLLPFFCLMMFVSCKNSYDTMFEEFNLKYAPKKEGEVKKVPAFGESGFDEKTMIYLDLYSIDRNSVFCLTGPKNATSYQWIVTIPDKENSEEKKDVLICSEKNLNYQMPGVLSESSENILSLVVKDSNNRVYKDEARIILYKK